MSTDLAPMVDADTVARVLLHGDLKQLTPSQKISYYRAVCESVGLNPLTQPFAYIVLNGKEVLYALKGATDQLRAVHHVAITIAARELVEDTYVVTARAQLPDGRTDESIGAVPLGGLKGESRANAMMKAETKAKRRVTLSMVGLGMLDETEVESLPMGAIGPATQSPTKLPILGTEAPRAGGTAPPMSSTAPLSAPAAATGENRGTVSAPGANRGADSTDRVLQPAAATEENRGTIPTWREVVATATEALAQPPDRSGQSDDLPAGFVRVMHINTGPTKNPSVTKYFITFSNGEEVTTINSWLASLAQEYLDANTPVRVKTRQTKYGTDLMALMTSPEGEPPEPPPADGDIPF